MTGMLRGTKVTRVTRGWGCGKVGEVGGDTWGEKEGDTGDEKGGAGSKDEPRQHPTTQQGWLACRDSRMAALVGRQLTMLIGLTHHQVTRRRPAK